jgi:hypothetical protein
MDYPAISQTGGTNCSFFPDCSANEPRKSCPVEASWEPLSMSHSDCILAIRFWFCNRPHVILLRLRVWPLGQTRRSAAANQSSRYLAPPLSDWRIELVSSSGCRSNHFVASATVAREHCLSSSEHFIVVALVRHCTSSDCRRDWAWRTPPERTSKTSSKRAGRKRVASLAGVARFTPPGELRDG